MDNNKELLERLVGMVADLQQSQLKMMEKQSQMFDNQIVMAASLQRLEAQMDRSNTVQLDLIKRVRDLEDK